MQELSWQYVDIIKADIEGMWWEFCNELLNKNIDFKFLVIEFELNFEDFSTSLKKAKTLCDRFKQNNYNVYVNKKFVCFLNKVFSFVRQYPYQIY